MIPLDRPLVREHTAYSDYQKRLYDEELRYFDFEVSS